MESPKTLNSYFTLVDDFFVKTFRDGTNLFFAIKAKQFSELATTAAAPEQPAAQTVVVPKPFSSPNSNTGRVPNFVSFSPRMVLKRDGTSLGKLKLSWGMMALQNCRLEQNLMLKSDGSVCVAGKAKDVVDGLTLSGRFIVNTISSATQDVSSVTTAYQRSDFYSTLGYQRNGLGSSNLLFDCGTKFFNLLLGAGFERQRISYLEQSEEIGEQVDAMYTGVGFSGVNWSIAAKMTRSMDSWNAARVAVLQRLSPSTAVACSYNFDLLSSTTHVCAGFTQGFRLCLPNLLQPKGEESHSWMVSVPLLGAMKAESDGNCSITLRGVANRSVHWGLTAQRNLLKEGSQFRYGLSVSMEDES